MSENRMNAACELGMQEIYKRGALDGMYFLAENMGTWTCGREKANPVILTVYKEFEEAVACKESKASSKESKETSKESSKESKASESKASFPLPFVAVAGSTFGGLAALFLGRPLSMIISSPSGSPPVRSQIGPAPSAAPSPQPLAGNICRP